MCHCVHLRFSPSHQFYIPPNITAKTYSHFFVYSRRSEMRSANMFHIHIFQISIFSCSSMRISFFFSTLQQPPSI